MELDPVDDYGNVQHTVSKINPGLILWGEQGITPWSDGSLIVPATDNIYRMSPNGGAEPVGATFHGSGIGPLLKSYVASGCKPGCAAAFEGHYILPVVDSSNVVQDVLVCRLDRPYLLSSRPRIWGYPWTRWSGSGAGKAFAVLPPTTTAGPKLLGVTAARVTDMTGAFAPTAANSQDADGTNITVTVETNDYPTQDGTLRAMVRRARLLFELTSDGTHTAPTVDLAYASDQDGGSYTTLTDKGIVGSTGTGGTISDGSAPHWWTVGKRRNRIRFKVTTSGAAASFVLRSLELFVRPTGKQ
jgi:hypothetical protein